MASQSYFADSNKKSEVNELKKLLDQADSQRDPKKYRQVVQKVIACMTLGMDMSSLFMHMVKAGATNDLIQKKLVYLYICAYAKTNTQLVVLTINTLLKDIQDRNSMIRGLALRSMTSLNLPDLLEHIEEPVITSLQDRSNYVRRTAVMGCVKLYHLNPDFVDEYGVIDKLKAMIFDDDPQVTCNCISALDEILASEGGLIVDQTMAHSLLKRLKEMNEWCQCQVLALLTRYNPSKEEELYDILNLIDARLKHPNAAVVMATIKLFFHLTKENQDLMDDVIHRIKGPLVSMMSSTNYEVIYAALCHIELLLAKSPLLFDSDYKTFFLRLNDPSFLRRKKIQILTTMVSKSNVEEIVSELSELVYDIDVELCQECIKAIGRVAKALPQAAEYCIDTLLSFLSCEIESITAQTLIVVRDLLPRYEKHAVAILPQLKECIDIVENPCARAAIIWMLGEYGQSIPESPYILENLVNTLEEEQSSEVKLQLLTAMMKLFFKRPPECQASLGSLLSHCVDNEMHIDVHDRALLYYRLLKEGVHLAESVVCGCQDTTKSNIPNNKTDSNNKEQLLGEFNTLSIIYGQPSVNFVIQTIPYIKGIPYQQDNDLQTASLDDAVVPSSSSTSDITVGNLLGNFHISTHKEAATKLQLVPHPSVSRSDFQQKWISLPTSAKLTLNLTSIPSDPNEFEEALLAHNITMMAFGGNQTQKYFHFAQQVVDGGLFFIETNIELEAKILTAEFKTEVEESSDEFVRIYEDAVTKKWIEYPL